MVGASQDNLNVAGDDEFQDAQNLLAGNNHLTRLNKRQLVQLMMIIRGTK